MGDYTNGWGYNMLAGITIVFIILITLMMLTTTFLS
jgi:Mn2+/Fe2+ NRAMP family transporter